jgi:RHS repeat-associated protein
MSTVLHSLKRYYATLGVSLLAVLVNGGSAQITDGAELNRVKSFGFSSGNLVTNGSFENNYNGNTFEAWHDGLDPNLNLLSPINEADEGSSYDGYKHVSVKYQTPPVLPDNNPFGLMSDFFALKPNTAYTLFFRYRSKDLDLPGSATIIPTVHFWKTRDFSYNVERDVFSSELETGEPSSELGPPAEGTPYTAQSQWTPSTLHFTTPSQTNFGNIFLLKGSVGGAKGTFFFDAVYLTEGTVASDGTTDMRHPDNITASSKFLDGNSKIIQSVTQDGQRDIVSQTFYDELGRSEKKTLPIANEKEEYRHRYIPGITAEFTSSDYLFRFYNPTHLEAAALDDAVLDPAPNATRPGYPDAGGVPYAQTRYEDSPLGRVVESAGPGTDWKIGSGHTGRTTYTSVSEMQDDATLPEPGVNTSEYFVKEFTNSDNKLSRVYTDRAGKMVRRSEKLGNTWLNTDYAYDANGNSTRVLAPGYENRLVNVMEYNAANQLVSEYTRPTGTTRFITDDLGQVRFSQTAKQEKDGRFSFTRFDSLGRVVSTGEVLDKTLFTPGNPGKANIREFPCVRDCADAASALSPALVKFRTLNQYDSESGSLSCEGPGSGGGGPVPSDIVFIAKKSTGETVASGTVLVDTYFDVLSAMDGQTDHVSVYALYQPGSGMEVIPESGTEFEFKVENIEFSFESLATNTVDGAAALVLYQTYESQKLARLEGDDNFSIGRLTKTLSCNYELSQALGESGPREVSKTFKYDKYGNMSRVLESNGYLNKSENRVQMVFNRYDVLNRLVQQTVCGDMACSENRSHIEKMEYDQMGRVVRVRDKKDAVILQHHYDYIGQKSVSSLGGPLENSSLTNALAQWNHFHLHGWLVKTEVKKIKDNTSLFKEQLYYQNGTTPKFDGSITKVEYAYDRLLDSRKDMAYAFQYDDVNRLTAASDVSQSFNSGGTPLSLPNVSTSYTYLEDGRIASMHRGPLAGAYNYNGDGQLIGVNGNLVENRDMNLTEDISSVFDYDENGNLVEDDSKSQDGHPMEIHYRSDNLPYLFIYRTPGSTHEYLEYMVYDESGNRVSKISEVDDSWSATKSYFGSGKEIRERKKSNGQETVVFNEMSGIGRVQILNGNPNELIDLYLKDHLGSTRETYSLGQGKVKYAVNYYPYGKEFGGTSPQTDDVTENFTGKELDDGINLSYFGARYYDADLGLWISPDPSRQFPDPYSYTGNGINPVNGTDPDGRQIGMEYGVLDANELPAPFIEFAFSAKGLQGFGVKASAGIVSFTCIPYAEVSGMGAPYAAMQEFGIGFGFFKSALSVDFKFSREFAYDKYYKPRDMFEALNSLSYQPWKFDWNIGPKSSSIKAGAVKLGGFKETFNLDKASLKMSFMVPLLPGFDAGVDIKRK